MHQKDKGTCPSWTTAWQPQAHMMGSCSPSSSLTASSIATQPRMRRSPAELGGLDLRTQDKQHKQHKQH